jgi:RNA polymerase sigma factor (sigma-70 family)
VPDGGELHTQVEYRAAFDGLRRFFAGRGVPAEEAADLAQETLTRTFVHIKRHGRNSEDLWPLLTTVARNIYSDRGRRGAPTTVPLTEAVELVDADPTPDDVVLRRERRAAVRAAVASLPARHRRAIELELRGMTPADVARELGIKRNAADALLHRARRSLASKLESMRGAFGALPLVLRLRNFARKTSAALGRLDPTGAFAMAATGIAAVALVGALGGSSASRPAISHDAASASLPAVVNARSVVSSAAATEATSRSAAQHVGGAPTLAVSPVVTRGNVALHVRTPTDPANRNGNGVDAGIYEKPDGRPSMLGDVISNATAGVCTQVCAGGGGH